MAILTLTPVQTGRWSTANTNWQATFAAAGAANRPTMRFEVAVPQGATINTATITFTRGGSATPALTMCAWDTDHVGVLATPVDKSHATLTDGSASGLGSNSYDVAALLQTIVNRTGWASGNGVAFWLSVPSAPGATITFSSVSLTIDYTDTQEYTAVGRGVQIQHGVHTIRPQYTAVGRNVQHKHGKSILIANIEVTAVGNDLYHAQGVHEMSGTGVAPTLGAVGHNIEHAWGIPIISVTIPPAPPPVPWEVAFNSQLWQDTLSLATWEIDSRVDVINEDGSVIAQLGVTHDPILRGDVTCDADAAITWTGTISVPESLIPHSPADMLHPLAYNRLRMWWRVRMLDGSWGEIPCGTMYVDSMPRPSFSSSSAGAEASLELSDAVYLIKKAKWDVGMSLSGVNASKAIERILGDRAPWATYSVTPTEYDLPASFEAGEPGGDPWDDIEDIAKAAGMIAYVDRMGVIRVEPRPNRILPTAEFIEGENSKMTDISSAIDMEQLANVVTVVSSNSEVEPPITARAEDNDPTSPLFVGRGYLLTKRIESGIVTQQKQAQTFANNELADAKSLSQVVEVTHRARPDLNLWDSVSATMEKIGVAGLYTTRHWNLELGDGMQRTTISALRRV